MIDTSLSTIERRFDGTPVGDQNGDGKHNTILDAAIKAGETISNRLIELGRGLTSQFAVVEFNWPLYTQWLDMNPATAARDPFTVPYANHDLSGGRDIPQVLKQLRGLGRTSYEAALQTTIDVLQRLTSPTGTPTVIFVSDGAPNPAGQQFTDKVDILRNTFGANIHAIGLGSQSSLQDLRLIDPNARIFHNTDDLNGLFQPPGELNDSESASVRIQNVAPTITSVASSDINEGQTVTIRGTFSDPARGVRTEAFSGTAVWSDGVTTRLSIDSGAGTFTTSRKFRDDHPSSGTARDSFQVRIVLRDDDLGSDTATTTVNVHNVAPSIETTVVSDSSIREGQSVTVSGTFDDPARGVSTETFHGTAVWSDGETTTLVVDAAREGIQQLVRLRMTTRQPPRQRIRFAFRLSCVTMIKEWTRRPPPLTSTTLPRASIRLWFRRTRSARGSLSQFAARSPILPVVCRQRRSPERPFGATALFRHWFLMSQRAHTQPAV